MKDDAEKLRETARSARRLANATTDEFARRELSEYAGECEARADALDMNASPDCEGRSQD